MSVVIIQYNAGNTTSVKFALARLGIEAIVTSDATIIRSAEKVILPGVGAAGTAMQYLQKSGLDEEIRSLSSPVLGICLGMQLMCQYSEEDNTNCLNILDQKAIRFHGLQKVPHTGWNQIKETNSPLFNGVHPGSYVYFVHSYYVPVCSNSICKTDYMQTFSAGIQKDNFYGLQFHPEKSGIAGDRILQNFLNL